MATVHPSRLNLVPQESKPPSIELRRGRSPSPRPTDGSYRSQSKERTYSVVREDEGRDASRDRVKRDRARADDYFDGGRNERRRQDDRSRSADRQRDRERTERRGYDRPRRPSPEYSEYRRPLSPRGEGTLAPWHQPENMYLNRRDRVPHGGHGGGNYMDSRREQRETSSFSICPPSPKSPTRSSSSPDGRRHRHSRKRHRRDISSSSDSEELSRSEHRSKRRHRREKGREHGRERSRHHHRETRSRSLRYDSDSEEDYHRHRRSRSRTESEERRARRRRSTRTRTPQEHPRSSGDEDDWVEKPAAPTLLAPTSISKEPGSATAMAPPSVPVASSTAAPAQRATADEESDEEVGPQPPPKAASTSKRVDERQYGGALLRGEGSAMAVFLKDGTDVRIPRRGEIGLRSDEIASFESVGYVMSGSRHKRMNAVRMRKENQVISAEEKRGILKLQQEERARREAILREEFEELVQDNLKAQGAPS